MLQNHSSNITPLISEPALHAIHRPVRVPRPQAASTKAAYEKDISRFIHSYGGTIPCSADDLIRFIAVLVKRVAPVTIARRCQSIRDAHVRMGHTPPTDDPRVREAMRWMVAGHLPHNLEEPGKKGKRPPPELRKAVKPKRVAKIIDRALLLRMFDCMGTGMRTMDRRDKAILLLGAAGMKRGAICSINIEDLVFTEDTMLIRVGHSQETSDETRPSKPKTHVVTIPFKRGPLCAAGACQTWIKHNDMEGKTGALFPSFTRSGEPTTDRLASAYVSVIIKDRLKAAGIADVSAYSGESLRRGYEAEMVNGRTL